MREDRDRQKKLEKQKLQRALRKKEKLERKQRELLEQKKKTTGNRVKRLAELSEEEFLAKTQIKVGFRGIIGSALSGVFLLIFFSIVFLYIKVCLIPKE